MYTFDVSADAWRDLAEILAYIALHSGIRARDRVEEGIFTAFASIKEFPGLGRLQLTSGLTVRATCGFDSARRYVIYYRIDGEMLEVVRILDGAQDAPRHLGGLADDDEE